MLDRETIINTRKERTLSAYECRLSDDFIECLKKVRSEVQDKDFIECIDHILDLSK